MLNQLKQKQKQSLYNKAAMKVAFIFEAFINVDPYLEESLRKDLARAGIDAKPKKYICMAMAKSAIFMIFVLFSLFLGIVVISVSLLFLSFTIYFKERFKVKEILK